MNNINFEDPYEESNNEDQIDLNKYIRKSQPENKSFYSSEDHQQNQENNDKSDHDEEPDDLNKYKRSYVPGKERHLIRSASRVAETVAGFPGNTIQFAKYIGGLLPETPQFLKRDPSFIQKYGKEALEMVPTSEDLKKASQDYFGLWTTPQDETEKVSDEGVELFTNLMIPLGQQQTWLRAAAASGGGVTAKSIAKQYGAPEWAQEAIKFATTMGISMFNPGGARDYRTNLYNRAEAAIPNTISVPGQHAVGELGNLRANLSMGGGEKAKGSAEVIGWIDEILDHINSNGGRLNVKEGQSFIRNINEAMGDPENLERARTLYPRVIEQVRNAMQQVEATYPEYWNLLRSADEAHRAIAQGSQIGYRVQEAIKKSPLKSNLGVLMAAAAYNPIAAIGYVAGRGLIKATDILSQIARSPVLRHYYNQMLRQGLSNDKTALLHTVQNIDKEAMKEEKKEKSLQVKFDIEEEKKLNANR